VAAAGETSTAKAAIGVATVITEVEAALWTEAEAAIEAAKEVTEEAIEAEAEATSTTKVMIPTPSEATGAEVDTEVAVMETTVRHKALHQFFTEELVVATAQKVHQKRHEIDVLVVLMVFKQLMMIFNC